MNIFIYIITDGHYLKLLILFQKLKTHFLKLYTLKKTEKDLG